MEKNIFKEALLEKKEFTYTLELVPGRGSRGKTQDDILRMAEQAAKSRLVHAVSVTDNPGGHPALSPDVIGLEISRLGIDPIIHFTGKDKNRNQVDTGGTLSEAVKLVSENGAHNIRLAATHGIFSRDARERLIRLPVKEVLITNTLPQIRSPGIRILDISPLVLDALAGI